ncbi:MAG: hypothetical protein B6D38_10830 [Anaerolineae bacterium UTCFX1]|jgi:predicted nucleic-acid-binding Zn-ribbon protein|nr:MAG: hypothetical protein B6D38_10830 [Anaerolineae bacterium UTCFX1]
MEAAPCPKCKTPVDKDRMSWTGNNSAGYASNKQTGMLRVVTKISQARACPNCGFVEMYLDPNELKLRLSGK